MSAEKSTPEVGSLSLSSEESQQQHVTTSTTNNEKENNGGDEVVSITSFDDFGLTDKMLRGLYSYGFEKPSEVQQKAIKPIMEGNSVIIQAQSGTGKTASYLIGILPLLDYEEYSPQALVLAPTRELSYGISHLAKQIGTYCNLRSSLCVGGIPIQDTMDGLQNGPQLVVGTPGRVSDILQRGMLEGGIRVVVVDETDEILSRGFGVELRRILLLLGEVQVVVASASISDDVSQFIQEFVKDPVHVLIPRNDPSIDSVKQFYVDVRKEDWKFETLCDLYESLPSPQLVVYCSTARKVNYATEKLKKEGYPAGCATGQMNKEERAKALQEFRSGNTRIMIVTDLLARAIDDHYVAINYDLPRDYEVYCHRVGRRGRFGSRIAINFVGEGEMSIIRDLEAFYNTSIQELPANISELE